MEAITRHNYESFFLDFAEGNLSNGEREAVLAFVAANPDLAEELEAFDIIEIVPENAISQEWTDLKKSKESNLEELFFKSVEGTISHAEEISLEKHLENPENQKAFTFWKQTILQPEAIEIEKDPLYHLELVLPIGTHNYEHFLIAKAEGLLDANQDKALVAYAETQSAGEMDLRLASTLRLQPAKGIFYPDKKALYKKEKKGIVWFYQAAAVAAILVLGAVLFTMQDHSTEAPSLAHEETKPLVKQIDSLDLQQELNDTNTVNTEKVIPLEEWEMREPDPSFVAEQKEEIPEDMSPIETQVDPEPTLIAEEAPELELEETLPKESVIVPIEQVDPMEANDMAEAESNPALQTDPALKTEGYKTVPEFTEDILANKLNIPDEERDQMALAIAKKVTDKATEMLDSELTREESDTGDQLTYTLRIKKFKIQHSRKR